MLIDQLHEVFPSFTELRMREIRVDKQQRKVFCTLSYPPSVVFDNAAKSRITEFVRGQMPTGYICNVKFAEDVFTVNSFLRNVSELIRERYPVYANIGRSKIDVKLTGKNIDVTLKVNDVTKSNMEQTDFCSTLTDHYAEYTSYNVSFTLKNDDADSSDAVLEQETLVRLAINKELLKPSRYFHVTGQHVIFGKELTVDPMYIADLRKPVESCTVCGVVSGRNCRQSKKNPLLYVCSFTLTDDTGASLPCILFLRMQITDVNTIVDETGRGEAEARTLSEKRILSNDKRLKTLTRLADGMSVVVRGKTVVGQNGQLEMHVYDLCSCQISPISPEREFTREVADEYLLVKPEDCTEYRQMNFVEHYSEQSVISDKNYVVLHVNSTGLGNVVEDKIYALCAVKVVHGHVTERFFSYVNPEKEINDERALEHCKIAASKLIFYPTLTEIISDLYKFCYDCELVGNNLSQIVQLLDYYAAPMNYKFTNNVVSQTDVFGELFAHSRMENSGSTKLEDVVKKCKVSCPDSVFCYDTALAAARCMSFLAANSK